MAKRNLSKVDETDFQMEISDEELGDSLYDIHRNPPLNKSFTFYDNRKNYKILDKDGRPIPFDEEVEDRLPKQWMKSNKHYFEEEYFKNGIVGNDIDLKTWLSVGEGFKLTSKERKIRETLDDLFVNSRLWNKLDDWVRRLFYESGEVFILNIINSDGSFDFRTIEGKDISDISNKSVRGVVHLPEDNEIVLGYYRSVVDQQNIKHSCFDPSYELFKNWEKLSPRLIDIVGTDWSEKMQWSMDLKRPELEKHGYIFRFVIHLKYFSVANWLRGKSPIERYIYFLNLYMQLKDDMAQRKRAQSIFARLIEFDEAKGGRTGWRHVERLLNPKTRPANWKEILREEGLVGEVKPGESIIAPPGASVKPFAPEFSDESGKDDDLADLYTVGQNLDRSISQGRTDHTRSSIEATRSVTEIALKNIQKRFHDLLLYDFLKPIFEVKSSVFGFPSKWKEVEMEVNYSNLQRGDVKKKRTYVNRETWQMIQIILPLITIKDNADLVNALYGSKHLGSGQDMSREMRSQKAGILDLEHQLLKRMVEDELYGPDLTTYVATQGVMPGQVGDIESKTNNQGDTIPTQDATTDTTADTTDTTSTVDTGNPNVE